jgi:hypothetical protein
VTRGTARPSPLRGALLRAAAPSLVVAAALAAATPTLRAQSSEPRAYSNAPVGMNFLIGGLAATRGGVAFDTLPITDPHLETWSAVLGYARALDLWGRSGKVDVVLPYTRLSGTATYQGGPIERDVDGPGDPLVRLSVNLLGAPALALPEFRAYQQDLIVGASLQVSVPAGQYDATRLVNIGTHRWAFKPEVGLSKALGSWTLEGAAAATLYTTNDDFYNGNRRSQAPLYSLRANLIHNFAGGTWASLDGTVYTGGRTTLNGTLNSDLQQNWRVGATLALPVDRQHSVKFYGSRGVSARTGNSFDLFGVAWQVRWGGGL